jgi:hypothetical protein
VRERKTKTKKVHFVLNVGVMFARSVSNAPSSSSVNIGSAAAPVGVYLNTALHVFVHGRGKYLPQRRRTSVLGIRSKWNEEWNERRERYAANAAATKEKMGEKKSSSFISGAGRD